MRQRLEGVLERARAKWVDPAEVIIQFVLANKLKNIKGFSKQWKKSLKMCILKKRQFCTCENYGKLWRQTRELSIEEQNER